MPIQAIRVPYVVTVVLATTRPSSSATQQPAGSQASNRRQSSSVWFQPACSRRRWAAGTSASIMARMCGETTAVTPLLTCDGLDVARFGERPLSTHQPR